MIPPGLVSAAISFAVGFFRDGTNSSMSRLIAFGGANIMAIYLLADIVARYTGKPPMSETIMEACVYTLGALGGVAYAANKMAEVKRSKADTDEASPV